MPTLYFVAVTCNIHPDNEKYRKYRTFLKTHEFTGQDKNRKYRTCGSHEIN